MAEAGLIETEAQADVLCTSVFCQTYIGLGKKNSIQLSFLRRVLKATHTPSFLSSLNRERNF